MGALPARSFAQLDASCMVSNLTYRQQLENELKEHGVQIDDSSLIQAAASNQVLEVRLDAIDLLGERKAAVAVPALLGILESSESPAVRRAAAMALAKMGDERGLKALHKQLEGAASVQEKLALAGILANSGDTKGYRELTVASESSDPDVRVLAARDEDMAVSFGGLVVAALGGDIQAPLRAHQELLVVGVAHHLVVPQPRVADGLGTQAAAQVGTGGEQDDDPP